MNLWGWNDQSLLASICGSGETVPIYGCNQNADFKEAEHVECVQESAPNRIIPRKDDLNSQQQHGVLNHDCKLESSCTSEQPSNESPAADTRKILADLWKAIKSVLESPKVTKIFYDGKFHYKFLRRHFGTTVSLPLEDLMLNCYLCEAGLPFTHSDLNDTVNDYLHFQLRLPKCEARQFAAFWMGRRLCTDELVNAAR